jgi:hypothetical protein
MTMSPGDVRTFKRGKGNAVVVGHGLWAERQGEWIHIHLTGPDNSHTTVTNNPKSVRFHRTLFRDLRTTLINQSCWPFGEEGIETMSAESKDPHQLFSSYNPVPLRGEPVSNTILRDRGSID